MKVPVSATDSPESGVSASDSTEAEVAVLGATLRNRRPLGRRNTHRSIWSHPVTKAAAWVISVALGITVSWTYLNGREPSSRTSHVLGDQSTSQRDSGTTSDPERVVPLPRRLGGSSDAPVALIDRRAGYRLQYPGTWTAVATAATRSTSLSTHLFRISQSSAFSVTSFRLAHAVTATNLTDLRAVTDAILSTPDAKLVVLDVRELKVGGLPAVYYLYYFPDGAQRGIHAHYFIFDSRTMHTLVFQVVPEGQFAKYAAQFDQVVASFKSLTH